MLCIFSGRASAWWTDPASGARRKVASLRERACVGDAALACCPPAAVGYNAEVRADTPLHVLALPRAALPPARADAPAAQPHSVLRPEPGSLPETCPVSMGGRDETCPVSTGGGGAGPCLKPAMATRPSGKRPGTADAVPPPCGVSN